MSIIYPSCTKCEGMLNIKFNNNLYLDFCCDKNENHKGEQIFFPTFEKFYFKENNVRCSKCNNNLLNRYIFEVDCKNNKEQKGDKIFCSNCFQEIYENIKMDNFSLNIKSNKCKLHDSSLNHYCIECKKNICIFCIIEDEMGIHKNHNIKNIENFIPNPNEIDNLKKRIKQKSKIYKELINKINIWKNKIITKTEQLIENLEKEMLILDKIVMNFNNKFMNYTYYINFSHLNYFVKNINNEYLINFNKNLDFREQCLNLIDLFTLFYPKKLTTKILKTNIEHYHFLDGIMPEKINNHFYFDKSKSSIINYNKYNINKFAYFRKLKDFSEEIYTISLSLDRQIIYACLNNKKVVKFLNFDQIQFSKINKEIIDIEDTYSHFNKCIQLTEKYLATADDYYIKIWKNNNKEQLEVEIKIVINSKTSDLLLVNNEYFISSQPYKKTIIIININTFEISKTISNVDSIDSQNSLLSLQNFTIINCKKGIQLLFKETKEIIQNIQILENDSWKKELYVYNNRLYVLQDLKKYKGNDNYLHIIKISIFEFFEGLLEKIQEYEEFQIDDDNNNLKFIVMNDEQIFLLGKNKYILN